MLSACPCTQSWTWLLPQPSLVRYRFSFSSEGFPLLGRPKEQRVDMRRHHRRKDITTRQSHQDKNAIKRNKSGCGTQQQQTVFSFHDLVTKPHKCAIHEQIKAAHRRPQRPIYVQKPQKANKQHHHLAAYLRRALTWFSDRVSDRSHRLDVAVSTVG